MYIFPGFVRCMLCSSLKQLKTVSPRCNTQRLGLLNCKKSSFGRQHRERLCETILWQYYLPSSSQLKKLLCCEESRWEQNSVGRCKNIIMKEAWFYEYLNLGLMVSLELFTVRPPKVSGSQWEGISFVLGYYHNTFLYQWHKNIWEENVKTVSTLRKKLS